MGLTDGRGKRGEAATRVAAVLAPVAGATLATGGITGLRMGGVALEVAVGDGVAVVPGPAALGAPAIAVAAAAGRGVRVTPVLIPSAARRAAASEGAAAVRVAAVGGSDDPVPA